jgi:hypothetical protein
MRMKIRHIYYIFGALIIITPFLGMSLFARQVLGVVFGMGLIAFTYIRFVFLPARKVGSDGIHMRDESTTR